MDKLEALADERRGDRLAAVPMDVTDAGQRKQATETARERFGPIDVLVNNAGVGQLCKRAPHANLAYGSHAASESRRTDRNDPGRTSGYASTL